MNIHCYMYGAYKNDYGLTENNQRDLTLKQSNRNQQLYGPRREKTHLRGFLQSQRQIGILSYKD